MRVGKEYTEKSKIKFLLLEGFEKTLRIGVEVKGHIQLKDFSLRSCFVNPLPHFSMKCAVNLRSFITVIDLDILLVDEKWKSF